MTIDDEQVGSVAKFGEIVSVKCQTRIRVFKSYLHTSFLISIFEIVRRTNHSLQVIYSIQGIQGIHRLQGIDSI